VSATVLSVEDLGVAFTTDAGRVDVVGGVTFDVREGETLGVVGESGCGKSVTALAVMALLPQPAGRVTAGRIRFDGVDLTALDPGARARFRGRRMSMIFQEPMTALNPVQRVGAQLTEAIAISNPSASAAERRRRALELLDEVGIPAATQRLEEYPHQLSGGMRQRVLIAIALACTPRLLIADEPTTALDVTIQAQILELLARLKRERGMAVLFITHDLGVIAEIADRVVVMYGGRVVERGGVEALFAAPRHPYSRGLLDSMPRLDRTPRSRLPTIPGVVPALDAMPSGCRFRNRCPRADAACASAEPEFALDADGGRGVACFHRLDDHA
jgi:peptide/nickel transport system ATP-binding protein